MGYGGLSLESEVDRVSSGGESAKALRNSIATTIADLAGPNTAAVIDMAKKKKRRQKPATVLRVKRLGRDRPPIRRRS